MHIVLLKDNEFRQLIFPPSKANVTSFDSPRGHEKLPRFISASDIDFKGDRRIIDRRIVDRRIK